MLNRLARYASTATIAATLLGAIACSDDDPTGPGGGGGESRTIEVNAVNGWTYLNLESNSTVTVAEPSASEAWDMAFNGTAVMLNGGAAGPGGVSAACDCSTWTLAEVEDMTAESELPRFEAATALSIPAASAFVTDNLLPAVTEWYTGSAGTTASANSAATFLVRQGDPATFLKFRVTSISGASLSAPGDVTIEYALQDGADFGTVETRTVTVADDQVYVSLTNGGGSAASWDLLLDGWTVRVNGGVSGSGGVRALRLDVPFATVDMATAGAIPASVYAGDSYGGIFVDYPWQVYSGPPLHQVFPTFDVYYVKRGDDVYKVQLTSYYNAGGEARYVTVLSERL